MTTTPTRKPARKVVSEAERERRAAARKEQTEALHTKLVEQVDALQQDGAWDRYLEFASSFHSYSLNNTLLILAQRPTATQVAGFNQWLEKGRQVRKGEKAIKVYGYSTRKITDEDPDTGEKVERKVPFYPVLSVFAFDQTDPIDEVTDFQRSKNPKVRTWAEASAENPTRLLEGEDESGVAQRVINHITARGWTFTFEEITGGSNGYTTVDGSKRVAVKVGLSPAQTAKTCLHELAHSMLHTPEEIRGEARRIAEVEAESVAFVVAGALGLDTSDYSTGYVMGWSGGDKELIRSTAERVLKTAHQILEEAFPLPEEAESK